MKPVHSESDHSTDKLLDSIVVDAWAKSGEGVSAAQRAEAILQHMHQQYQTTRSEHLKPTTGIFNAVINAWARSKDKVAPARAEQILQWMEDLHQTNPSIQPDKYTFNTGEFADEGCCHALLNNILNLLCRSCISDPCICQVRRRCCCHQSTASTRKHAQDVRRWERSR
jgi:hypothetical protein